MFKVKNIKTLEIVPVLSAYCDEYGKSWFLFWENDAWRWRPADNFVPPNCEPKKRTIIAGSRNFTNIKLAYDTLAEYKDKIKVVLCGEAKGADTIGRQWAEENHIPIRSYPADWQKYPTAAGYVRNKQMGDYGDELVAFWDGVSPGTNDMITYMKKLGKKVTVIEY